MELDITQNNCIVLKVAWLRLAQVELMQLFTKPPTHECIKSDARNTRKHI